MSLCLLSCNFLPPTATGCLCGDRATSPRYSLFLLVADFDIAHGVQMAYVMAMHRLLRFLATDGTQGLGTPQRLGANTDLQTVVLPRFLRTLFLLFEACVSIRILGRAVFRPESLTIAFTGRCGQRQLWCSGCLNCTPWRSGNSLLWHSFFVPGTSFFL